MLPDAGGPATEVPGLPLQLGLMMTEAQLASSLYDARALIDALILASHSPSVDLSSHRACFCFGDVEVDLHYRRVTRGGREVALTPREYDLLVELARANGAPVSNAHLITTVWKNSITPGSRTIAQHVAELRSKLERKASAPEYLFTVRKYGYRLLGTWTTE
jgi:DNA-binding response OmpR family regulator